MTGLTSVMSTILNNGNVSGRNNKATAGIGTTSPASLLSVQGNGLFSGNVSLANLTATGNNECVADNGASTTQISASNTAYSVQDRIVRRQRRHRDDDPGASLELDMEQGKQRQCIADSGVRTDMLPL